MNVLLSACLDRDRQDGGGFRSRDDGDDKTLGDWRKKEDRGSDKFSDRDRKGEMSWFSGRDRKSNCPLSIAFLLQILFTN